jgi:signal transduction histidine kinase
MLEINRDDHAGKPEGHPMATTKASVETSRSLVDAADQTLVRATTTVHDTPVACGQARALRPVDSPVRDSAPMPIQRTRRARTALGGASERRRLERDLHDGVQGELVALIFELAGVQQDPETPPALAHTLAVIEDRAQAALDSVRSIAHGIYPPVLADLGLARALRAQATRAGVSMSLVGTAPRGSEEAEEAVYFACSEAIQNVVKHAGDEARVVLGLVHHDGSLIVRISDDGPGFDRDQATEGGGLNNIRDRIEDLSGTFGLVSKPGFGTVLTMTLPWPTSANREP